MPLYEYECEVCGHRFESIRKFSDAPLEQCPKCGGAIQKLQSAPAFHLKGTGWYATDYAKKEEPAGKAESASSEAASSANENATIDKGEKSQKADKTEKTDKTEKSDRAVKTDKNDKAEKSPSAKDSSSSSLPPTTSKGSRQSEI